MSIQFKGKLEKVTWNQVRAEVAKINPEFAAIIDEIDPSDQYWLAKVTYPYGSLVMKKALLMLPNKNGDIVPITDPSLDAEIRDGLEYNLKSNPVSFVLKNTFEIFLPLEDRAIPFSGLIYPGSVFGAWRVLNPHNSQHPAFLWDMTSGARSVFMLPKITEAKKHFKLKKKYNLTAPVPKSLMDHWEIFRQLANHSSLQNWNSEIICFPKQWFTHLKDKKWHHFFEYFRNMGWIGSEFWRNQPIFNLIFSVILKNYESRPSAYIMDTVKYLLYVGIGFFPGMAPAYQNTLAGPFDEIQKIYLQDYELKYYAPTIMQPILFNMYDVNSFPVYYSLQFPNALEFKPNARARVSIISDMHEIKSLLTRYQNEFLSEKFNVGNTSLDDIFKNTKYDYFHTGVELHEGMRNSCEIAEDDTRFLTSYCEETAKNFPDTCSFVKGCIRLSHKKTKNL